jgi:hypothetical protein
MVHASLSTGLRQSLGGVDTVGSVEFRLRSRAKPARLGPTTNAAPPMSVGKLEAIVLPQQHPIRHQLREVGTLIAETVRATQ